MTLFFIAFTLDNLTTFMSTTLQFRYSKTKNNSLSFYINLFVVLSATGGVFLGCFIAYLLVKMNKEANKILEN